VGVLYRIRREIVFFVYILFVLFLGFWVGEFYCRKNNICKLAEFRYRDWPNMDIFTTSEVLPFEVVSNIPNYTNSLGMRDKEYSLRKKKGIYRIIVLGDSITMYGEYTDYLEEDLSREFGSKFEVWNCAIGGHGVKDYYYNLRYRCIKYSPDMLIVGLCINDFALTPVIFKTQDGRMHCYRPFALFKNNSDNFLYCHSNLYRFILIKLEGMAARRNQTTMESTGRLYMSKIKEIARRQKIPVLAVIFPYFKFDSEFNEDYKVMRKVVAELNVECIDLHTVFNKDERGRFLDNPDDYIHPNSKAHRIVADLVREYVIGRYKETLQ